MSTSHDKGTPLRSADFSNFCVCASSSLVVEITQNDMPSASFEGRKIRHGEDRAGERTHTLDSKTKKKKLSYCP